MELIATGGWDHCKIEQRRLKQYVLANLVTKTVNALNLVGQDPDPVIRLARKSTLTTPGVGWAGQTPFRLHLSELMTDT